jgi:hypothetical protein
MRFYLTAALLLVLVSGCNEPEPTVSMTAMNSAEFDKLVASHKGKVVVVDLWALW